MLHTSPKSAAVFAQLYDHHGDSYTDDVNTKQLKEVFGNIQKEVNGMGSKVKG